MPRLLKNLLPREPLPANVHVHVDHDGNRVWCEEPVCRPNRQPDLLFLPSGR